MSLPPGDLLPGEGGLSPTQLFSTYQYGDLIHWGSKRDALRAVESDPFDSAWTRIQFLDAATALTHLYLGFALIVKAALGRPETAS